MPQPDPNLHNQAADESAMTPQAGGEQEFAPADMDRLGDEQAKTPEAELSWLERVRLSLKRVFARELPLQDETTYFILANVLDIVLTNILLNRGAMESNPLANYVLIRWGFNGMIAFKMLLVAFICVLAQVIARKSLLHARLVLVGGTVIVGLVVAYSAFLGFFFTRA